MSEREPTPDDELTSRDIAAWKGWPVQRADALMRAIGRDDPSLLIRYEGFRRIFVRRGVVDERLRRGS